jgi:hypothetical protein
MLDSKTSTIAGKETKEKLPGPKDIPSLVKNYLVKNIKFDPDLVNVLRSVSRKKDISNPKSRTFYIRIFDEADAYANKVEIKNYLSLDDYPGLIILEGWYDESTSTVELTEKNRLSQETTIYTEEQILQKIQSLSQPGSSVFFFMARGPASGGPLGRGASIIQLTPVENGKKAKKYTIFTADVVDMKPVDKINKLYESNKEKDIAKWIKEAHHKRMY